MKKPKLIYLVTEDNYFYSHRLPMAQAALRCGFEVAVITNVKKHGERIEAQNIRVIPLSLERRSLNPLKALGHIAQLCRIYRQERPDIVHHIAMKPVLYGSIAACLSAVPVVINAFAGLGYLFTADSKLARILRLVLFPLFRLTLRRPACRLLLQNDDDLALLRKLRMVPKDEKKITVIRGSGIDTAHFSVQPLPSAQPDIICAFAARLIGIKGLPTLQDAFEILKAKAPHIKLWLCGTPDPGNPGSWTAEQVAAWAQANPNIIPKGHCSDMHAIWSHAHMALQPSYGGEGVPKALLEAAATGRAIIATDVPGCRDMVREGRNGHLVPARDEQGLAQAIMDVARDPARCAAMGLESRRLVEEGGFSADAVTAETERLYKSCL